MGCGRDKHCRETVCWESKLVLLMLYLRKLRGNHRRGQFISSYPIPSFGVASENSVDTRANQRREATTSFVGAEATTVRVQSIEAV